jgi:hypothetical protein
MRTAGLVTADLLRTRRANQHGERHRHTGNRGYEKSSVMDRKRRGSVLIAFSLAIPLAGELFLTPGPTMTKGNAMPTHTTGARRIPRIVPPGTARSIGTTHHDRRHAVNPRRGSSIISPRVALLGLGIAIAWGLFLWLSIGTSITSFGNPWLS